MPIWVSIQGAEQLAELSKKLKGQGRTDLQRELRKQIRDAARPLLGELRTAVMAVQVTSDKGGKAHPDTSTALRARVARALTVSQTQKGVRIKVSATRFGPYGVTLPRYLDADLNRWKRWRHPVFWKGSISTAPPKRVVQQKGSPWFFVTIVAHRAQFRQAVFDAMDKIAKEITG